MNSKKNYYQLYLKYKGRYLAEQKRQEGGGSNWYIYYNKQIITINTNKIPIGWYLINLIESTTCPSQQQIKAIYNCKNPPIDTLLTNFNSNTLMQINKDVFNLVIDATDTPVCRRVLDNPYLNFLDSTPNVYTFYNQNTNIGRYKNISLGQLTITTTSSKSCNPIFDTIKKISQIKDLKQTELNITPSSSQVCLNVLVDQYIRKLDSIPTYEDNYSHLHRNP